jgi:hypothetical protein
MNSIAGLSFVLAAFSFCVFLYKKFGKKVETSETKNFKIAGIIFTILFVVSAGFASPGTGVNDSQKVNTNKTPATIQTEPVIKEEKVTEDIPFESQSKDDSTLAKGTTKVQQEGVVGKKEKNYKVTYQDGKEVKRELTSEVVMAQPIPKITLNGTYVYVAPTTNSGYTNVDGNYVQSPTYAPSAPAGATAKCGDGSYSFSQHRSGTCSHHGGVAQWL